ncbi:MAG: hypothetical protein AB1941_05135 [Gemmatimonadota bacterium]
MQPDPTFEPVPPDPIPTPRAGVTYFGVAIPDGIPLFDCRWPADAPQPRHPVTDRSLWASERAEHYLRTEAAAPATAFIHTFSTRLHFDTTDPAHAARTGASLQHVVDAAVQALDGYTRGRRGTRPRRADTFHRPLGIALCNFGCVLLADLNDTRHLVTPARRAGQVAARP